MIGQLHGRSREQRYTRFADWQYINQCSDAAQQLPVFGEILALAISLGSFGLLVTAPSKPTLMIASFTCQYLNVSGVLPV